MAADMVKYKDGEEMKNSWIRYILRRTSLNKNNLGVVIGQTGSGKTWSAISICELISKENKVPFNVDNIVFGLLPLMKLINSGKLKKGSSIIYDEPQVSISSRSWQSKANMVFNHLLSTFRYMGVNMFFCTPYEDLLDKSTRKLFHMKFELQSINKEAKTAKIKPKGLEYNSHLSKEYEWFLLRNYKPVNKGKYVTKRLKTWDVPKPSDDIIKAYEEKREIWQKKMSKAGEKMLMEVEKEDKEDNETNTYKYNILKLVEKYGFKNIIEDSGVSRATIYKWHKEAKDKNLEVSQ